MQSLSNQELVAIILRTGTRKESVLQLSSRLLHDFEGLFNLKDATIEELLKINGIGQTKAIQLLATMEFGRRISRLPQQDRYVIRSPEDGASYLMDEMRFLTQEHFICLYLNTKNQVIHQRTVFIGN